MNISKLCVGFPLNNVQLFFIQFVKQYGAKLKCRATLGLTLAISLKASWFFQYINSQGSVITFVTLRLIDELAVFYRRCTPKYFKFVVDLQNFRFKFFTVSWLYGQVTYRDCKEKFCNLTAKTHLFRGAQSVKHDQLMYQGECTTGGHATLTVDILKNP